MTSTPKDFNKARASFMRRASAPHVSPFALKLAYLIAFKHMDSKTRTARPIAGDAGARSQYRGTLCPQAARRSAALGAGDRPRKRTGPRRHLLDRSRQGDDGKADSRVLCGWLPRCKGFVRVWRVGRVQSCVRPVCAVMTAGPDGFRGRGPILLCGLRRPGHYGGLFSSPVRPVRHHFTWSSQPLRAIPR